MELHPRPVEEKATFEEKRNACEKNGKTESDGLLFDEMIPDELKNLEFVKNRIYVKWACGSGKIHNMQIMDWEVVEQQRRLG